MSYLLCGLVGLSALIQGGYYPGNFLAVGAVVALLSILRKRKTVYAAELALWGFSALYLLASLANGYSLDSLSQACLPLVCSFFLSAFCGLKPEEKTIFFRCLLLGTGLVCGVSILSYVGVLPFTDAEAARRLQFPFQYANAAGSWLAATAIAIGAFPDERVQKVRLPCLTALFLTRSVGALALYAVCKAVLLLTDRPREDLYEELAVHILAGAFSVALWAVPGWPALPVVILLYVAGYFLKTLLAPGKTRRWVRWPLLALAVGSVAGFLLTSRFSQSTGTFFERIVQISDGLRLLAAHPVFGVGAGNWGALYPYYQTAQYTSTVFHSSLIQFGADAGIGAVLLFILFLLLSACQGKRVRRTAFAALFLILHSTMDFTLQFFPVFALLLSLLFADPESRGALTVNRALFCTGTAVAAALCAVMLFGQTREKQMIRLAGAGDYGAVISQYEASAPLLGDSLSARELYFNALYFCGNTEKLLSAEQNETETLNMLLLRAISLHQTGHTEEGCRLLLSELERQIYRVALFEETAALLREWNAPGQYFLEYNELAARANENRTLLAQLKGDQVDINEITIDRK